MCTFCLHVFKSSHLSRFTTCFCTYIIFVDSNLPMHHCVSLSFVLLFLHSSCWFTTLPYVAGLIFCNSISFSSFAVVASRPDTCSNCVTVQHSVQLCFKTYVAVHIRFFAYLFFVFFFSGWWFFFSFAKLIFQLSVFCDIILIIINY